MKNKRVKQMICDVHKNNGIDTAFESREWYGANALVQWGFICGDGFSEWIDSIFMYGHSISLTGAQLKGSTK